MFTIVFNISKKIISTFNIKKVDGILFDLGISSRQIDVPERGFSFRYDGPLDMRMNREQELTASTLIHTLPLKELAGILKKYGEERWSLRIAKKIVQTREKKRIETTKELAEIVRSAVPRSFKPQSIHPATRTFQALRIMVNEELDVLEVALRDAVELLKIKGRICVISFHSLEDRIAKQIFNSYKKGCICPPKIPQCICGKKQIVEVLTRRPVVPGREEVENNPRARSAKLRVAERIA